MPITCVFACAAYIYVPKDKRKKLDPKAKKGIYLGYSTTRKGYCPYDQKTSSIIHSSDVVFNELARGHECEEDKRPIYVESLTDEESEDSEAKEVESADNSTESESETQKFQFLGDLP